MGKFHISIQILQGNALLSGKITQLKKFYTTAGRDGRDKFQVCSERSLRVDSVSLAHYRYLFI